MKYINFYDSPLGKITLASDGESLTGLWFDGQKFNLRGLSEEAKIEDLPIFETAKKWLDVYFGGKEPNFRVPIVFNDTDFRVAVWKLLTDIPYGETVTYKSLAEKIAKQMGKKSMSAQAVGGAVGHNPISIIVPCHRVVGSDGSLTGYAGGMNKKLKLLRLEGVDLTVEKE